MSILYGKSFFLEATESLSSSVGSLGPPFMLSYFQAKAQPYLRYLRKYYLPTGELQNVTYFMSFAKVSALSRSILRADTIKIILQRLCNSRPKFHLQIMKCAFIKERHGRKYSITRTKNPVPKNHAPP